jgi:hypothetical protein
VNGELEKYLQGPAHEASQHKQFPVQHHGSLVRLFILPKKPFLNIVFDKNNSQMLLAA